MLRNSLIISILFLISISLYGQSNTVLFRFNGNHNTSLDLSSEIETSNITFNNDVDPIENIARGPGGWGYYAPVRTVFSGNNSFIKGTEKVRISFAGDHNLSGEIWFKPEINKMAIFSWNDPALTHGIDLYMDQGKIVFERRFYDTTIVVQSESTLTLDEMHYVSWTLRVTGSNVEVGIYIDGVNDVKETLTLDNPVGFAIINASVFIGKSEYNTTLPNFKGILSALNFKSYIPQESYLTSFIPFDGSEYLGIPAYMDKNIGTANGEGDQMISDGETPMVEKVFVPYMNEDFIPQGLTNTDEDTENIYNESMVYSALYNKNVSGVTKIRHSIIVEMDPNNNYKVRRVFRLGSILKYGHVGGIAFYDNKFYVASDSKIEVYNVPAYNAADNKKYYDITAASDMVFNVATLASYVTFYNDSLWVGEYRKSGLAYMVGYPLDEEGRVDVGVPPKIYRMPNYNQGAAWTNVNGTDYLFISTSGSSIDRVNRANLSPTQLPVSELELTFPRGGEDLSFDKDQNLYAQSEAGAKHFQLRSSPWSDYYPFFFKLSYETLFDGITSVEDDEVSEKKSEEKVILNSYPNPANGTVQISVQVNGDQKTEIRIVDILGRVVEQWNDLRSSNTQYRISWDNTDVSSGVYFLQAVTGGSVHSHKMIILK